VSVVDKIKVFKPDDILFREGTVDDFFYIVQEGEVGIFKDKDGKRIPLAVIHPGQCVGEFSALDQQPRSATATALSEVKCLKIDSASIHKQLDDNPEWFRTIVVEMIQRIRHTDDSIRRIGITDAHVEKTMQQALQGSRAPGELPSFDPNELIDDGKGKKS